MAKIDSPKEYKDRLFKDPSLIQQVENCIYND